MLLATFIIFTILLDIVKFIVGFFVLIFMIALFHSCFFTEIVYKKTDNGPKWEWW
jgi:hypothetical protein